jgi:hypothetical protein
MHACTGEIPEKAFDKPDLRELDDHRDGGGTEFMAVVYFYIPSDKLEDVTDCGIKLSEWKDRDQATRWSSIPKPCLCAFLHPLDDRRHQDPSYRCVKLDIPVEYLVVANRDLYRLSLEYSDIEQIYIDTMVPLQRYIFGSFRRPECLVFTTVLSEQIKPLGRGLDEPILYESSETLYVNNLLEKYNDRYDDFNQVLLYSFLTLQQQKGFIDGLHSTDERLAVFFDSEEKQHITVPIPDIEKYKIDQT